MNANADSPVDAVCPADTNHAPAGGVPAPCPMAQLLDTLAGKWTFSILHQLIICDGPVRFGKLQLSISGITQQAVI